LSKTKGRKTTKFWRGKRVLGVHTSAGGGRLLHETKEKKKTTKVSRKGKNIGKRRAPSRKEDILDREWIETITPPGGGEGQKRQN